MHAATLTSPRLQRVLAVLRDGRRHTTRAIVRKARVMAVSACISELRFRGAEISCVREMLNDRWVFYYTMTKGPTE
jgi:hypothetical protein